jgi:hypothetical protein
MNANRKSRVRSWVALAASIAVIASLAVEPRTAAAQASAKQKQAAAAPKTGAGAAKSAPRTAAPKQPLDTVAQQAVLQSPEWLRMMERFNDWLSVQSLYDADQVKQIKQRLDAAIPKMSAEQLKAFLAEMLAKLDVLTGERADDAQEYLTETFAVASPAYLRRLRQQLPDVLTMTPRQIDQRLSGFASKRRNLAQVQQSFEAGRQQQITFHQAQIRAQQQAQARAADRAQSGAPTSGSGQSNSMPARDYFPWTGDQFGSSLPFFGGFGWYPVMTSAHRF